MFTNNSIFELEKITRQRNIILMICACLVITNLIGAVTLLTSRKTVVLVPNFLTTSTEISSKRPSVEYIEAFSRDVIGLMLNITPDNAKYASTQILKVTHPAFHGKLKYELENRAEDVITRKISTYFSGQTLVVSQGQNQVLISGKLSTLLGRELITEEQKTYSISFEYSGFGLLITDFHEVKKEELQNENN